MMRLEVVLVKKILLLGLKISTAIIVFLWDIFACLDGTTESEPQSQETSESDDDG